MRWNESTERFGRSPDDSLFKVVYLSVGRGGEGSFGEEPAEGSQIGHVDVELVDTTHRDVTSQEITAIWREEVACDRRCRHVDVRLAGLRARQGRRSNSSCSRRGSGRGTGGSGRETANRNSRATRASSMSKMIHGLANGSTGFASRKRLSRWASRRQTSRIRFAQRITVRRSCGCNADDTKSN